MRLYRTAMPMPPFALALALVLTMPLAACSSSGPDAAVNTVENAANVAAAENAALAEPPPAPLGKAFSVKDRNDLLEFSYKYPGEAAGVPEIVSVLKTDMDKGRAGALRDAEAGRRESKANGFPFNAYSLETEWKVRGDTPRFLSIASETYIFSGGAHGMTAYDALLWDRGQRRLLKTTDLFTSPAAFATAARPGFCKALDAARAEKRKGYGEDAVASPDDPFNACVDPLKQTLVPVGKKGMLSAIRVIIGPYEAGPYVEGSYEIDVPVTGAVLAAVKPEYRGAFAVKE